MTKFVYDLKQVYALVTTTLSLVYDKVYLHNKVDHIDTFISQPLEYYIDRFCSLLERMIEKHNIRMIVVSVIGSTYPELSEYVRSLDDIEFIAVVRTIMEENVWLLYSPEVLRMLLYLSHS